MSINTDSDEPMPRWDVALEGLAREECQKKGAGLQMDDFVRLGKEYSIRLDDIMVTVFELVFSRRWQYLDAGGSPREITRDEVGRLYVNGGRLREDDLRAYDGFWRPTPE